MSFESSTVTIRMGVRDAAYKLGKVAERLTLGSGSINSGLVDSAESLCSEMLDKLEAAGYSTSLDSTVATVANSDSVTITSGTKTATATVSVADSAISAITLSSSADALVTNGQSSKIYASDGSTVIASAPVALVASNGYLGTRITSTSVGIAVNGNTASVSNSAGTVTASGKYVVANNVTTGVTLPATAALTLDGGTLSVKGVGATAVSATVAVASGVPTATLPGTDAIVASGQTLTTTDGGTVTLTIANGVISAAYTAAS